jgi:N utilization substance protein B
VTPEQRHHARQLALQLLCALDVQGPEAWPDVARFLDEQEAPSAVTSAARDLAAFTAEHRSDWDARIAAVSERWDIKRMDLVDRNILRLALSEMARPELTPARVAINEAIELAKQFGTSESPAFVNGVLDAIYRHTTDAEDLPAPDPPT